MCFIVSVFLQILWQWNSVQSNYNCSLCGSQMKDKDFIFGESHVCICELIKMYSFKGFSAEQVRQKPPHGASVLALVVMQTIFLTPRYQEPGAKLHFIRYRKTTLMT